MRRRDTPGRPGLRMPAPVTIAVTVALVAVTLLDLVMPSGSTAMPLLVAVPALVLAGRHRCGHQWWIGGATLATAVPSAVAHWGSAPVTAVATALGIGAVTWCAAASARSAQHREHTLATLREAATAMQRVLLRPLPRRIGTVRTEVRYLAAADEAGVGGDLYGVVSTPFGVRMIIGDVMGKGLPAVERAADVVGAFRELAQNEARLANAALRLDSYLTRLDDTGDFVTALLVGLPADEETCEVVCCGHPPPLLVRDQQATYLSALSPEPPLGLMSLSDGWYRSHVLTFGSGDRLLLYTDGVSEARDRDGQFYPLAERASTLADDDPEAFLAALEADLLRHVGGRLDDDAALLLVQSSPQPGGRGQEAPGPAALSRLL